MAVRSILVFETPDGGIAHICAFLDTDLFAAFDLVIWERGSR
ncbi:MAG: hypothetical protein ACRDVG_02815 [Jatrophihabitantaceae bacterium]